MSQVLFTIEECEVTLQDDGSVTWTAPAMIDDDGSGPAHGDPDEQPDTSLHQDGQPLNADVDRYIVVPPQIVEAVKGIVLGCQAYVFNNITGLESPAVVGDRGPRSKIGEMAIATAQAVGIPSSPTTGGEERHLISYRILPGVPAVVGSKTYTLQAA